MPKANELEQFVTIERCAEMICVTEKTIDNWVREGRFPRPYRISRRVTRFKEKEVIEFLERRKQKEPIHAS